MALPIRHYVLKLVNSSGQVLNYIRDAFDAKYEQTLNQSPTLTFSLPTTSLSISTIIRPNEIWLYDSTGITVIEKFRILRTVTSRSTTGAAQIDIECDGYLNQLTDELISSYQASPTDGFTITEIIEDLLALQVSTSPIVYDAATIASTLGDQVRSVNYENQTLLRGILALIETVSTPHYVYINATTKKLHIVSSLGSNIGQEIRLGKNLASVAQETDYSTLVTRLLAVGSGSEDVEVRLAPMGVIPTIYYSFNGTPNDLMSGAAGTYDLTAVGTPTYSDKLGPVNGDSIILNGSSQYLSHASSLFRQFSSRTISGYFKITSFPASSALEVLWCEQSTTDDDPFVRLEIHNNATNTRLRLQIVDDGGTQRLLARGTTDLALDTWYHFAVTDTGSAMRLMLNGVQEVASTAYVGTITTDLFTLGARKLIASTTLYADIELACIRIHDSIVSDANILIDATTTNKFIDSTAKTTYGIVPRAISDRSVTHPDTLFLAALTYLYENDAPFTSYRVSTLDLTKIPGGAFTSFESIALGSTVRLIDSGLSISTSQVAVRKTINLSMATDVSFEFSSLARLITEPDAIYSAINLVQSQAVETIGAGQVIVRGTFTVLNWVTDGETTIDGDNLTTGTITADKLTVDALSAITANIGDLEIQGAGATPGSINMPSGGVLKSGMTGFALGEGFWLENNGGTPRFAMGGTTDAQLVGAFSFGSVASWIVGQSTTTIDTGAGQMRFDDALTGHYGAQEIAIIPGASYLVEYVINATGSTLGAGNTMHVTLGGTAGITRSAPGSYSETIVAGSANSAVVIRVNDDSGAGTGVDFRLDQISVTGPDGEGSGLLKWDGSELTVNGRINATSIYTGILYADRIPRLDNVDHSGEYLQTSTPYGRSVWTSDLIYTSTNTNGSSANTPFYVPTSILPITCKFVARLTQATTGLNTVGTQTLTILCKIDGVTIHTVNYTEGGAVNFFFESAAFNITSGANHNFSLTYTFSAPSDLSNGFIMDQFRVISDAVGDHEVTS